MTHEGGAGAAPERYARLEFQDFLKAAELSSGSRRPPPSGVGVFTKPLGTAGTCQELPDTLGAAADLEAARDDGWRGKRAYYGRRCLT